MQKFFSMLFLNVNFFGDKQERGCQLSLPPFSDAPPISQKYSFAGARTET